MQDLILFTVTVVTGGLLLLWYLSRQANKEIEALRKHMEFEKKMAKIKWREIYDDYYPGTSVPVVKKDEKKGE